MSTVSTFGIVLGVLLGVGLLIVFIWQWWNRRSKSNSHINAHQENRVTEHEELNDEPDANEFQEYETELKHLSTLKRNKQRRSKIREETAELELQLLS